MERLETLASAPEVEDVITTGYIANDAEHPDDLVGLLIPSYDLGRVFGPSHFEPRTLQDGTMLLPQRNDPCLVGFDEEGEAHLLIWWAADPTEPAAAPLETTITGDGSTTLFTINHNLGTRNVLVVIRQNASPWEHVNAKVKSSSTSSVTIETSPALSAGAVYAVLVTRALGGATVPVSSPAAHSSSHLAGGSDPLIIPYVTSLPASPADGQQIFYIADAANGVAWHLKYRAAEAGSFKWYYVGGAPLQNAIATTGNTSSTSYVDLNGGLPAVTLPLAGDYDFDFTARLINQSTAAPQWVMMAAPKFGAAATSDTDAGMADKSSATGINGEQFTIGRSKLRKTGLAAGAVVKLQFRQTAANSCDYRDMHIAATPVRVG